MQILALVFLLVAITAWFAPAVRAARNRKFKLVPSIPNGSWIIRQSVGTTPVILRCNSP